MAYKFQNIKFITLKVLYGAKKSHYACEKDFWKAFRLRFLKSFAILEVIYVPHNVIISVQKCYKFREGHCCFHRVRTAKIFSVM